MERRKRRSPIDEYIDSLTDSPEKLQRCSLFYQNLRNFYRRKWNCPLKAPYVQGVEVNLFRLYETVTGFGGWQKVSSHEKWFDVAQALGVGNDVVIAEHAVKLIYMRFLSKYEQNELVGDGDDAESDIMGARNRSKGFSALATADCPVSLRPAGDQSRSKLPSKEHDRLIKGLICGLPNEVDFVINICTLMSHPGPHVLQLASTPQLIDLLLAHVAIFPDDDPSLRDLYKTWTDYTKRDFMAFWRGSGITDEDVLSLVPYIGKSEVLPEDKEIFVGLEMEFEPRNVVSWRVQQILLLMRNLSFEIFNQSVLATNWSFLKFLFLCCSCKWGALKTPAFDILGNIASEIDITCTQISVSNHLLLKIVHQSLYSDDKFLIIRALEIIAGLCNNERNESLLCEFLDSRVLGRIFNALCIKDVMICVYTLEALYQISELGAIACQQIARTSHSINMLVCLATVETSSFGPSGLLGMKVVEEQGLSQFAPPPPQNLPPTNQHVQIVRPGAFISGTTLTAYSVSTRTNAQQQPVRAASVTNSVGTPGVIGDSKVEQRTANWLKLNCVVEMGEKIPRAELYATYVEDLRHHYNALSGSMQMFTNIIKAIFPNVLVRSAANTTQTMIENLKFIKGQNLASTSAGPAIKQQTTIAASHPLVKKILSDHSTMPNGRVIPTTCDERTDMVGVSYSTTSSNISDDASSRSSLPTVFVSTTSSSVATKPRSKIIARRANGLIDDRKSNGGIKFNGCGDGTGVTISDDLSEMSVGQALKEGLADGLGRCIRYASSEIASTSSATVSSGRIGDNDTEGSSAYGAKRRRLSLSQAQRPEVGPVPKNEPVFDYMCEWNGCGRTFARASAVFYHCTREHIGDEQLMQCYWPNCDSTVRSRWSLVTHLQDHHCGEKMLKEAAARRKEGTSQPLGPVNPGRPMDNQQNQGYAKNAAYEAIRRNAFVNLPRDMFDEQEGPVTKSIRLTSCLILRNLARYSSDGRRMLRRHEHLISLLAISKLESGSALAQLLAELYCQSSS